MQSSVEFERWDTPFFSEKYPSVRSVCLTESLTIELDANGRYRLEFTTPISFSVTDEQIPPRAAPCFVGEQGSSVLVKRSDWVLRLGADERYLVELYGAPPLHFALLGGDWTIEVLSPSYPTISSVAP